MPENRIILDSNFILLPFQFKIDYLKEIWETMAGKTSFIIYQQVLDELKAKEKRFPNRTSFKRNLDAGINYLNHHKNLYEIEFIECQKLEDETTDDFLIRKCILMKNEGSRVFLATNDKELRKKAVNHKIFVIYMRQKKYIDVEGF